ncbi:hypothetical protein [Halomonas sp. NO4]|uniref:hypothetical protein n=1 Tax=Halomonas sp. NO4 TaxID=2484813 RepID=UPI0013D4F20A|nr:hypothetical protein [Halomonas sp. NO4]
MNKTAQLPAWIIDRYQHQFQQLNLSSQERDLAIAIIQYTLPPPTKPELQLACQLYARDHAALPSELSETLTGLDFLTSSPCTDPGTQYPLWYAISQTSFLNRTSKDAFHARQILTSWFTKTVRHAEPSIYRTQVQQVRDILVVALENRATHGVSLSSHQDVIKAMGHPTMSDLRHTWGRHYQTYCALYEQQRQPGLRVGHDLSGYRRTGNNSGRTRQLNRYQVRRREQIADATPATQQRITDRVLSDRAPSADGLDSAIAELGFRYTKGASRLSKADEPELEAPTIERSTPSQLTPSDDRRATRQAVQMAATNTLPTQEDVHRLTPWQIRQTLLLELPPCQWALVCLLLVTGMPVNRLISLTRSSHDSEPCDESNAESPQWNPDSLTWRYRCRDGPSSAQDGNTSHQWVTLHLPPAVNKALLSVDSATPLAGSVNRLNRRLRSAFRDKPGLTPTAQRLSATAWLFMRDLAPDNHLVHTLRGEYGRLESAPAAYRQIDRASLQNLFDAGLSRCGISALPSPPPHASKGRMGSSRAVPAPSWQQWHSALRDAIQQARRPLEQWLRPDPLPLHAVVEYCQLSAAYSYLGWLLATGTRPVSATTRTRITDTLAWISDKNSRRGRESRVIPILPAIAEQLQSHHALMEQTVILLKRNGHPIDDQRQPNQQWPAWIEVTQPRRPRCRVRSLHHADYREMLSRLVVPGCSCDAPLPADNATRHSVITALHSVIPEASLDALVGHARIGRDRCHPRANAPINQWKDCQEAISSWLQSTGYRTMNMEDLPWG